VPTGLRPRDRAEVEALVTIAGSVRAGGRVRVTAVSSADGAFDATDLPLASRSFRLRLQPGASLTSRLKFRVPRDLAAGSHLLVVVDADNRLQELNEDNNLADAPGAFAATP
jgi:hypothetical protein